MGESRCRLFVAPDALRAGSVEIEGSDHHYLTRVLRLAVGDEVELFDGTGRQARATLAEAGPTRAVLRAEEPVVAPRDLYPELTMLVALVKGPRMEWCLQKLVELGVDRIVPFSAARSVVRLKPDRAESRHRRLQAIAVAAARQCERDRLPELCPVVGFAEALDIGARAERRILLLERETEPLAGLLRGPRPASVALVVGPEGGFEGAEVAAAQTAGYHPAGLGPRILRAETAAVAAAAIVGFALGDIGSQPPAI